MTEQPSKYNMENVPSQNAPVQIGEILQQSKLPQPPSEFESESGESFNPSVLDETLISVGWSEEQYQEFLELKQLKLSLTTNLESILNNAKQVEYLLNSMRELDLDDREKCGIEFLAKESAIKIQELVYEHLEVKLAVRLRDDV